jgi:hypothetical protein
MEKILVYDHFLKPEEIKKAIDIINSNNWKWGHKSNHTELYETPFWHMDLINEEYFTIELKNIIEKHFGKKFDLIRVYCNGQTFGQDGCYHTDSEEPNSYTFCLYVSNIEKKFVDTAGGYIYFKFPDKNFNICFEPLFNRGVLFPANYLHKACAYNRYVMDMRMCVAWKLEEIIES